MSIKPRKLLIPLLLFSLLSSACGYKATHSIPPNVSKITIKPFQNSSSEPNLENRLTEEVTQQLLAHGELQVVDPAKANVVLLGKINKYRKIPIMYNEQDVPQQYKLRVEIALRLLDADTRDSLRRFENIFRETVYSDVLPPAETEYQAQDQVLNQLARDVVTSTVEGWPYMDE